MQATECYGNTVYGTIARSWKAGHSVGASRYFNSITNGVPLLSFPNPFAPAAGQVAAFQSASGFNPHLTVPYLQQWNVTLERQIGSVGVSVAYVGSHAVDLLYGRNINQPVPSTTPFSVSALPNPNFNTITLYENGGSQRYNSLQVSAAKRLGKNLHFSAGWTWARDLTDQSDNDWVLRRQSDSEPIQPRSGMGQQHLHAHPSFLRGCGLLSPGRTQSAFPEPDAESGRRDPGRMAAVGGSHLANRPVVHSEL